MTAAQQQLHAVFQSTMECVAAVCDELEPAFPDVAPHAAHFFRHGATGVLAEGVDVQLVTQQQTKRLTRWRTAIFNVTVSSV